MSRYRATIFYKDHAALGDVREHTLDVFGSSARKLKDDAGFQVDALVTDEQVDALKSKGFEVQVIQDVDKLTRTREELVGKGNRYKER